MAKNKDEIQEIRELVAELKSILEESLKTFGAADPAKNQATPDASKPAHP